MGKWFRNKRLVAAAAAVVAAVAFPQFAWLPPLVVDGVAAMVTTAPTSGDPSVESPIKGAP